MERNIYFKISACLKINPILLFFKKEKEKEAAQTSGADVRLPAKRNAFVATKGACAEKKKKKKKVARREEEEVRDQDCCSSGVGLCTSTRSNDFFREWIRELERRIFPRVRSHRPVALRPNLPNRGCLRIRAWRWRLMLPRTSVLPKATGTTTTTTTTTTSCSHLLIQSCSVFVAFFLYVNSL